MLSLEEADRSKKGSLDAPIRDLVRLLNASPNAFTTSSCSGRVALFAEPPERAPGEKKGKGGEWLHVSHERADADAVWEALQRYLTNGAGGVAGSSSTPDVPLRPVHPGGGMPLPL